MKKLAILLMLALIASACTERNENKPIMQKSEKSSAIESSSVMEEISLARVNNTPITAEDLREEFNMLNPQAQKLYMAEGGFEELLNELIKKEMLLQEAKKKDYATRDEYREIMDDYKERVIIGFLLKEAVEDKSKVSEEEARKYYDENRKDFMLEKPEKGEPDFVDFDSVKKLIQDRLESQKQAEVFEAYISNLKEKYKVEIDKNKFDATFGNIIAPGEEQGLQKVE